MWCNVFLALLIYFNLNSVVSEKKFLVVVWCVWMCHVINMTVNLWKSNSFPHPNAILELGKLHYSTWIWPKKSLNSRRAVLWKAIWLEKRITHSDKSKHVYIEHLTNREGKKVLLWIWTPRIQWCLDYKHKRNNKRRCGSDWVLKRTVFILR